MRERETRGEHKRNIEKEEVNRECERVGMVWLKSP